jgi:copper(I)-binding protein
MAQDRIPLSELLAHITTEIRDIHEKAMAHGDPVMKFKECECEFAIEAEDKAGGGFHVWVLKLGGGRKRTESNTIKIKYSALEGREMVAPVEAPEGARPQPKRHGKKEE